MRVRRCLPLGHHLGARLARGRAQHERPRHGGGAAALGVDRRADAHHAAVVVVGREHEGRGGPLAVGLAQGAVGLCEQRHMARGAAARTDVVDDLEARRAARVEEEAEHRALGLRLRRSVQHVRARPAAVDGARRLGAQVREVGHADADARDRREAAIGLVQPEEVEAVAAPVDMCEALRVGARQDEDARLLVRAAAQVLDQGVDAEHTGGERAQQHPQLPLGVGGRFGGPRLGARLLLLLLLHRLRPVRQRLHLLVGQLALQVRDERLGIWLARVATERRAGPKLEDRLQPAGGMQRVGGDAPGRTHGLVLGAVDAVQQTWVGVTKLIPEGIELLAERARGEVELDKGRSGRTHYLAHCLRVEGEDRSVSHGGLKEQQWANHRTRHGLSAAGRGEAGTCLRQPGGTTGPRPAMTGERKLTETTAAQLPYTTHTPLSLTIPLVAVFAASETAPCDDRVAAPADLGHDLRHHVHARAHLRAARAGESEGLAFLSEPLPPRIAARSSLRSPPPPLTRAAPPTGTGGGTGGGGGGGGGTGGGAGGAGASGGGGSGGGADGGLDSDCAVGSCTGAGAAGYGGCGGRAAGGVSSCDPSCVAAESGGVRRHDAGGPIPPML
eukprot:scaffold27699_cov63-Phaeocystis_antarctica.AAC.7